MQITRLIRVVVRAINEHRQISLDEHGFMIGMGIHHDHLNGERTIQPNKLGLRLLALRERYIDLPRFVIREHLCKHPNWVDESYGGPDSGCIAGYCPDCSHSFHHTLY